MTEASVLVAKLWSYCHVLRDDGLSYLDYLEQLTYLLFLKMAEERAALRGEEQPIPKGCRWADLADPQMEGEAHRLAHQEEARHPDHEEQRRLTPSGVLGLCPEPLPIPSQFHIHARPVEPHLAEGFAHAVAARDLRDRKPLVVQTKVILITGQYGTSHRSAATAICKRALQSGIVAKHYSIDHLAFDHADGADVFFQGPTDGYRDGLWNQAADEVREQISTEQPEVALVSTHVVYYWKKRFFSCVDWDRILLLRPHVILTLIDDIYDIQWRIAGKEEGKPLLEKEAYALSDILHWRLREIHTANLLAKHLRVNPELFPGAERAIDHKVAGIEARKRGMELIELYRLLARTAARMQNEQEGHHMTP